MAVGLVTQDTVAALIQDVYGPGALAVCLNKFSKAYTFFQRTGRIIEDPRLYIRWPIKSVAYPSVTNISDGQTLPSAGQPEYSEAVLSYKIAIGMIRLGRLTQLGATSLEYFRTGAGQGLLQDQMAEVLEEMARTIDLQIVQLASGSTLQITGLGDAVANNANTYAGIARAANAFWQPYVNGNAGTNRGLTEALLRDVHDTLKNTRGAVVDAVWCGTTVWHALEDLLKNTGNNSRVRYVDGGTKLRAGIEGDIIWNGIPFSEMDRMDTNAMFWLDFTSGQGIGLHRQHKDDFLIQKEATNAYDDRWSLAGHYQLKVHIPWRQGALLDVQ
ncbi:MAG: phage major capsid protein [Pseudomonadota bacterium]